MKCLLFVIVLLASGCASVIGPRPTPTPTAMAAPTSTPEGANYASYTVFLTRHVDFVEIRKGCYQKRVTWVSSDERERYYEPVYQGVDEYGHPVSLQTSPPPPWTSPREPSAALAVADYLAHQQQIH